MTDQLEGNSPGETAVVSAVSAPNVSITKIKKKPLSERTDAEKQTVRQYERTSQKKKRDKAAKKAATASYVYSSGEEASKKDAKEILKARGLSGHIVDVCYDSAMNAAQHLGITANRFLFQNGIMKALASWEAKLPQTLEAVSDEPVLGELSTRPELVAIHDFSVAWREDAVDFEEFLRTRRVFKTDPFQLAMQMGADFEDAQRQWYDFLPRFEPNNLPPKYTQRQMREWLTNTCEIKDYLLLASRNSMKSSASLWWLASLHLCCPDARALLCSETKKLSAGFIRSYRSKWEVKPNNETKMQIFFPEYCIPPGEGSIQEFSSPMSRLDLIQASATSTSMESAVTGGRCEVLLADDPISNLTCTTEEQCQKSVDLFDLLSKLKEVSGSFSIVIGTPWRAEIDLYATLLKRNEADSGGSLAFRVDPVATLKKEAQHKLTPDKLATLTPEDIESYLLPVRMPWKWIKSEISKNPAFALSQNFILFPNAEETQIKLNFDRDVLMKCIVPAAAQPVGEMYLSADVAYSSQNNRYADNSAIAAVCIHTNQQADRAMCVFDMEVGRMRGSEFALNIVKFTRIYKPRKVIIERGPTTDLLNAEIVRVATAQGVIVPIYWVAPSNKKGAKLSRLKGLETCLVAGKLTFRSGAYLDTLFNELTRLDGKKSNGWKHDDQADALSIAQKMLLPAVYNQQVEEEDSTTPQEREAETNAEKARRYHQQMYGDVSAPSVVKASDFNPNRQQPVEPPPTRQLSPREQALRQMLKVLPPGLRGRRF